VQWQPKFENKQVGDRLYFQGTDTSICKVNASICLFF